MRTKHDPAAPLAMPVKAKPYQHQIEAFGDLIYETINANSLSAFVKEQMAENADTLPGWLNGLVNIYEKATVGVRKATRN